MADNYYGGVFGYGDHEQNPYAQFGTTVSTTPKFGEFGSGVSAGITQPGYTAPRTAPQAQTAATNAGWTGTDWIQATQLMYGMYKDRNPSKPKFEPTPLSPEQRQLHELYLKSLMNPSTANNVSYLNDMAQQQLANLSNMKWTSPRTFSGDQGYSGSNLGFKAPWAPGGSGYRPPVTGTPPGKYTVATFPFATNEDRIEASRFANAEGKRLHYENNSSRFNEGGDNIANPGFDAASNDDAMSWDNPTSHLDDIGARAPWMGGEAHPWFGGAASATGATFTPEQGADALAQYKEARERLGAYANKTKGPDGEDDETGLWGLIKSRVGAMIPDDEEGRERYATRALSLLNLIGIPVPPPNLLDRAWDGLQGVYRYLRYGSWSGAPTGR